MCISVSDFMVGYIAMVNVMIFFGMKVLLGC